MKNSFIVNGNLVIIFIDSKKFGTQEVFIDFEDLERVSKYNWGILRDTKSGKLNAISTTLSSGRISMQRLIRGTPKGRTTQHISNNTLDNRKSNLGKPEFYTSLGWSKWSRNRGDKILPTTRIPNELKLYSREIKESVNCVYNKIFKIFRQRFDKEELLHIAITEIYFFIKKYKNKPNIKLFTESILRKEIKAQNRYFSKNNISLDAPIFEDNERKTLYDNKILRKI